VSIVPLAPTRLSDPTWRRLVTVLGRRRFRNGSGSDVVDWAVDALVAGWESPSLNVLGGLAKPPNEFEVDRYVERMMQGLGVEMPDESHLADLYALAIALDLLAGAVSPYEGARELSHLWMKSAQPKKLQPWFGYEDEYELARDGVYGDVADVEEARRLVAQEP
jgi:hypothetical protein